jgi:hypothetical protein
MEQVMIDIPIEQEERIELEKLFGINVKQDLAKMATDYIERYMVEKAIREKANSLPKPNFWSMYGILRGKYEVPENFKAPMEEFKDYM